METFYLFYYAEDSSMGNLDSPLDSVCGHPFSIWNVGHPSFSDCFETLAFVLAPFSLLAITSSFYIGKLRPPDINQRIPSLFNIRRLCTGATFLITLGMLLKDVILIKSDLPAISIISYGTRILSLLVHFVFLWRLGLIHFDYKRCPAAVIISWLLTLGYYGVHLEHMIVVVLDTHTKHSTADNINTVVDLFFAACMTACQLIYLVSLIQSNPKYRTVSIISVDDNVDLLRSEDDSSESDRYTDVGVSDVPWLSERCPSDSASLLSLLFFHWVQPLMRKGAKKHLNKAESVYYLPLDLKTKAICDSFFTTLQKNNEADDQRNSTSHVLLKSLHTRFGRWYYTLGILKFLSDALAFAGPILLNELVSFVDSSKPLAYGCYYAAGLFASTLIGSLLATHFDYQVNKVATGIKSCLISTIYNKTMHTKPVPMSSYTTGEITNFMSTDVNRIVNFCPSFHQFWSLPFQVTVTLVLLYFQVGIVFLAGLGFALLMILFNRYLAKKIGEYNVEMMKYKDSRVKLMTELLLGIRVVKFNVWEGFFTEEVNSVRSEELKNLKGIKYFDAGCVYLWATTPVVISLLIFSIYSVTNHQLTAAKVFTVVALINMLIAPLNAFPWVINGLMEAWVSLNRMEKFVSLPDFDPDQYYNDAPPSEEIFVHVDNGSFSWNEQSSTESDESDEVSQKDQVLNKISLSVRKGHFIGVIGTVGSGKSSLLSALSAVMEKTKGDIAMLCKDNGVAYVTQDPWIQHATIKHNITWGEDFDSEGYEAIIDCCALKEDLMVFPTGDMTEVGENGATLSGGQKARISLARAVYQNKELYLLDDPLSAVDQHVASHLYHQCIMGILKDKTRILCTHHTRYLRNADLIVVMDKGRIKECGTPSDVLGAHAVEQYDNEPSIPSPPAREIGERRGENATLVKAEEKATGTVALTVYKAYWTAIGGCLASTILMFVLLMQGSKVVSDWWLAYWVNSNPNGTSPTPHMSSPLSTTDVMNCSSRCVLAASPLILTEASYTTLLKNPVATAADKAHNVMWYLTIYGCIAAANSIFTLVRSFSFAYGGICAARTLHENLFQSILRAPVSFFDVTPVGRIINRFSSDMYTVDDSLPFMLNILLAQLAGLVATIIITCYGLPWFTLVLLPLSVFYYFTQRYYRLTSRELKRLSSISLSPIYAQFNESLLGITTIKAFRKTEMFIDQNLRLIDSNQRCNFSTLAAQEWLAIRLQMMGVVMVTAVALTAVFEHEYQTETVTAGMVGLALSYALSVTSRLSGVITSFTETEKQMVAVERQSYYINNVPHERSSASMREHQIPYNWPQNGAVEFRHVTLQYRRNLPNALDDLSFSIRQGEKVGIVGRTGSGKSSIFSSLFGVTPLTRGAIYVDEINISRVPLRILRSRMAIIPQDPFLFSGSLRANLDPSSAERASDDQLWATLESCGLREAIERMGGLDSDVGERGQRLSTGQRQLLCLARALLKQVQIVCLDEATANIDRESDVLIQDTVRKYFTKCTVLTIAHRIETIMDSDRVLVMENGRVLEFSEPHDLLRDPGSAFSQLVAQAGLCVE